MSLLQIPHPSKHLDIKCFILDSARLIDAPTEMRWGAIGVFCLVDLVMLQIARGARQIDIRATAEHILDQCPMAKLSQVCYS